MLTVFPQDFLVHFALSWKELAFGWEREWVGAKSVVDCAVASVTEDMPADAPEVSLASLTKETYGDIDSFLEQIVGRDTGENENEIASKWLYIHLEWFYQHRDEVDDALRVIETIYANFDYPDEIAELVRYMPSLDAATPKTDERIMHSWEAYLEQRRARWYTP